MSEKKATCCMTCKHWGIGGCSGCLFYRQHPEASPCDRESCDECGECDKWEEKE